MRRTAFRRLLFDNPWRHNGTWAQSGAVWTNTPGLGSSLLTNGDMESAGTWTANGSPTSQAQSNEQAHGGSNSWKIVTTGANAGATQSFTTTTGVWYYLTGWIFSGSNTAKINTTITGSHSVIQSSASSWTQGIEVAREPTGASRSVSLLSQSSVVTAYFDDVAVNPLTLNQLLVLRRGGPASTVTGKPTLAAGTQAGVCAKVNALVAPTNGVFVYHDGTNIKMDKLVAGTWTNLISTAVTYSAGATIEIRSNGTNTWQAWYGGTQSGTDQAISDVSIVNNSLYGGFSTYSGNTITDLVVA